ARNPGEFRIIRRTSLARTERLRDQCARLSLEPRLDANGRRCRCGPAGTAKWPPGGLLQMRHQMAEIAHVLRLLLAPDELGGPVRLQSGRHSIGWKWPELLEAHQRHLPIQATLPTSLQKLV